MKKILLFHIATYLIISLGVKADDYLHPSGYNIVSSYTINDSIVTFGDTIIITRTITNNELFNLNNLFLTDHIPLDFMIIDQTVEIDGTPVDYIFSGVQNNLIYTGYSTYHWTLDSPIDGESVNNLLHSSEILTIRYWAVSTDIGNYIFPLHSACFIAEGESYFVTSDSLEVNVVISSGIDDDPETNNLLPNYIISNAYPNPFNAEVRIQYEGKGIGGQNIEFEIYNILGQKVHHETVARSSNNGEFFWKITGVSSSGIYFYQINTESIKCGGKLILVK